MNIYSNSYLKIFYQSFVYNVIIFPTSKEFGITVNMFCGNPSSGTTTNQESNMIALNKAI